MYILGIESSCDETSIAVIEFNEKNNNDNNFKVLANVVSSQIDIHKKYGGVVPEIASRHHTKNIGLVLDEALDTANIKFEDLCAIAVTVGPGLVGALLVGVSFAKALAYTLNIPLVPVHHIAGHIAANFLTHPNLKPPFLALVVSGGHSHVIEVKDYTSFSILARTRDDAVGEAFDKVARVLNLGYPGGPEVSKHAQNGQATYKLPKTKFEDNLDFSFSGVKTAVLNIANKEKENLRIDDMCTSFENNVAEVLVDHTIALAKEKKISKIALAGGVSANRKLRELLVLQGNKENIQIYLPELKYCTDNAAMITAAGIFKYREGKYTKDLSLNAKASMNIENE
ncbi:MAG: tRNA (adenosine(37)-N6)-threonylcarbamoyltransferase complex transferase subunit TsaD [Clostridia bacterium]|nr:tRNA (adenosine(37)-N6)-threonylcarbamoyltransferase complex transferase subunit TsaD [Clostridia bacterium]